MIRYVALAINLTLVLVACSDEPAGPVEPPEPSCDATWVANGYTECEAACRDSSVALLASGPSCSAVTIEGNPVSCQKTFVYEGVTGCCSSDAPAIHFASCQ